MNAKQVIASITLFFFVIGISLMAIAERVDGVFLSGLGLFILGLVISIVWGIWNTSGWAEKQTRKYFD